MRGCWFISCWALNWCILYEILPCHFSVSESGPSALSLVTAICRRLSDCMHWSAAQVSAALARDHNCSIPCLELVRWLAFQPSHWSINHAPNYMCTDLCCMPGFSLAFQWLLRSAPDWPDCCIGVFWLAGLLTCILLSASHFGSGSADWSREIARYLTKLNQDKII